VEQGVRPGLGRPWLGNRKTALVLFPCSTTSHVPIRQLEPWSYSYATGALRCGSAPETLRLGCIGRRQTRPPSRVKQLTGSPQNICHRSIPAWTGKSRFGGVEATFKKRAPSHSLPREIEGHQGAGTTPRWPALSFDQATDDKALKAARLNASTSRSPAATAVMMRLAIVM
jgi:hypothetical protein